MFDLIAVGPEPKLRRRQRLATDTRVVIGRADDADFSISWEPLLSRRHVSLQIEPDGVRLSRLETATNPVFHHGKSIETALISGGGSFVIGGTMFRIVPTGAGDSSQRDRVLEEVRFDAGQLRNIRFSDADKRIEVLTHLPQVIAGARTEEDFFLRIVQLLLAGIPQAEAVAIVEPIDDDVNVLHWDRRNETLGAIRPSTRLVNEAVLSSRRSILHVWEPDRQDTAYTATAGFNWAFCTPVRLAGESPRGLYVAGQHAEATASEAGAGRSALLQADVRFTELAAEIVSSLRRLSMLERQQAGLRQFFAPPILDALGENLDTAVLEPRECEVTVLFCDLRGFSQQAEHSADNLIGLLGRVSEALGVMTEQILRFGGVTGDFQGDAALGFWGWPFESDDAPLNACRSALGIREAFENAAAIPTHPLANFQMGIGIAHGRAVAGKIGTADQVKVTVFGPVVNLASRLESMTTQLRVPILLDEPTTKLVRDRPAPDEGRTRTLARILPVGMETPVMVSELLPSESQYPLLTNQHIERYEEGVRQFIAGDWESAWQCLHEMPAIDRAQDFLSIPIVQSNRRAPAYWDGIIRLQRK